jgi:hypothetical protein
MKRTHEQTPIGHPGKATVGSPATGKDRGPPPKALPRPTLSIIVLVGSKANYEVPIMLANRILLLAVTAVCLSLTVSAPAAERDGFTIEQVLSAPFPSDLVSAPKGALVAWVFNHRGARNIWVAAPPDYRGRKLTSYAEDDGQEISGLDWSPDGSSLVYVRGGEEGGGEYPNPLSKATVPEQAVWAIAIDKGTPHGRLSASSSLRRRRPPEPVHLFYSVQWFDPSQGSRLMAGSDGGKVGIFGGGRSRRMTSNGRRCT